MIYCNFNNVHHHNEIDHNINDDVSLIHIYLCVNLRTQKPMKSEQEVRNRKHTKNTHTEHGNLYKNQFTYLHANFIVHRTITN